jgi:hypothetical protein
MRPVKTSSHHRRTAGRIACIYLPADLAEQSEKILSKFGYKDLESLILDIIWKSSQNGHLAFLIELTDCLQSETKIDKIKVKRYEQQTF